MRWILMLLIATGCGQSSTAEAPAESEAPEAESTEPSVDESEASARDEGARAAPSTTAERPPALSAEAREGARVALRAGRDATRQGDLALARESFDRAIELNPLSALLHCEAGFAALGSDEPDDRRYAEQHLVGGLALFGGGEPSEQARVPLAMCLYNRGLLAEQSEDWQLAEHYLSRSLELRDNALVGRHLRAAREQPEPVGPEEVRSLVSLVAFYDETDEEDEEAPEEEEYAEPPVHATLEASFPGEGDRPEVGVIDIYMPSGMDWGNEAQKLIAINTGSGYYIHVTRSAIVDGDDGCEFEAPIMATPDWLLLDSRCGGEWGHQDECSPPNDIEDAQVCYETEWGERTTRLLTLCRLGDDPACSSFPIGSSSVSQRDVECDDDEGTPMPEWARNRVREPEEEAYDLTFETSPEHGIRMHLASGEVPSDPPSSVPIDRWIPFVDALELRER